MNTDVIARLFVVKFLLFVSAAAFVETTVVGQVVNRTGHISIFLCFLICVIGLLILADILVNDWLPKRHGWEWIRDKRDLLYIAGGFLALFPGWYMCKMQGLSLSAFILYLGSPTLIFSIGLADIRAKVGEQLETR